jgi:hypothetical protein
MKYEIHITYHSKDMANVKSFCIQTDRRTGQKLYAPDLLIRGHTNETLLNWKQSSITYPAAGTMAIPSARLIQNPAPPVANQKATFCYKIQSKHKSTFTQKII